jgi:hypothetical protein
MSNARIFAVACLLGVGVGTTVELITRPGPNPDPPSVLTRLVEVPRPYAVPVPDSRIKAVEREAAPQPTECLVMRFLD